MGQTYYEIYRDDTMALARSVIIKNSHVAVAINSETIDFTQANLRIHRATAREYTPGSVYYNNLVSRYPTQADLINGIISPVDMTKAINSQDGAILYYDSQYVEDNEDTFYSELQDWVNVFFLRWFNEQYLLIDDLELPRFIGQLYSYLPMAIMLIRMRNCRTNRAHSFHIREYLGSHSRLDRYIPYLSKQQQLWLYRNIEFLKHNAGKEFVWERLVKNLLTNRGIPLIGYTLEQNVEKMPDVLYPDVELVKHDINSNIVQPGYTKVAVDTLLTRERDLARFNVAVQYDTENEIIEQVKSDQYASLPTKVLDSEVIDRGASNIRSLEQVLFNEWIYLVATNRYRAYINVISPSTGEYINLTVRDALVVCLYAYGKTRGYELNDVPELIAYEVLRNPLPTHEELESIIDPKYVPEGMIQAIMDRVTPLTEYISTESFYNDCYNLHQEYLKLWELYSFQEHYMTRGYCEQLVKRHFMHIRVKLVSEPTSFAQYFKDLGIEVMGLGDADLDLLLTELIKTATGANLVTVITLGEIQAQLLRLMGDLSSYPLQYLRNISSTDYRQIGVPAIRAGDYSVSTQSLDHVNEPLANVFRYAGAVTGEVDLYDTAITPEVEYTARTEGQLAIDPLVDVRELYEALGHYRLNASDVGLRGIRFVANETPDGNNTLMEYDPLH